MKSTSLAVVPELRDALFSSPLVFSLGPSVWMYDLFMFCTPFATTPVVDVVLD